MSAKLLHRIVGESPERQLALVNTGLLPTIAQAVTVPAEGQGQALEGLLRLLIDLCSGSTRVRKAVVDAGVLPGLLQLVDARASPEARDRAPSASMAIRNLAAGSTEESVCDAVVDAGAVPVLANALSPCGTEVSTNAVFALDSLAARLEGGPERVLEAGALTHLV